MAAITLTRPELVERLQQVATEEDTSAEELLDRVVVEFLETMAVKRLKDETVAFAQLHLQLVKQFFGHYVAVHNRAVIDHDPDLRTLHLRIRTQFGQMPILLRQVTDNAKLPEIVVRSPRLVATEL